MKRGAARGSTALTVLEPQIRPISGHLVGRIVAREADTLLVTYPDNPHGPLPARSTVGLPQDQLQGIEVLMVFERERSDRPIVVGVLRESVPVHAPGDTPREALIDGERVVLSARDEIVLRCGRASITLRRNGRVIIRGAYVETRAEGVNRVRGGSVQIN